jgi:hypothetical protein
VYYDFYSFFSLSIKDICQEPSFGHFPQGINIETLAHPHTLGSIKKVLLLFEAVMSSEFWGKLGVTDGCKNQPLLRSLANLPGSINMTDYKAQSPPA